MDFLEIFMAGWIISGFLHFGLINAHIHSKDVRIRQGLILASFTGYFSLVAAALTLHAAHGFKNMFSDGFKLSAT